VISFKTIRICVKTTPLLKYGHMSDGGVLYDVLGYVFSNLISIENNLEVT